MKPFTKRESKYMQPEKKGTFDFKSGSLES